MRFEKLIDVDRTRFIQPDSIPSGGNEAARFAEAILTQMSQAAVQRGERMPAKSRFDLELESSRNREIPADLSLLREESNLAKLLDLACRWIPLPRLKRRFVEKHPMDLASLGYGLAGNV